MENSTLGEVISSTELCRRTGITYRQLNHWMSKGLISALGEPNPGSGIPRRFNPDIINKVKLMGKVSKAFDDYIPLHVLQAVYDAYDIGFIKTETGIKLSWEIDDNS